MRTHTGHHVTPKIGGTGEIATHTETETDMNSLQTENSHSGTFVSDSGLRAV